MKLPILEQLASAEDSCLCCSLTLWAYLGDKLAL